MGVITKVDARRIIDLRPKSDSSSDISRALQDAQAERARAAAQHDDIKAQRGAVLLRGTRDEIDTQEQMLRHLAGHLEDLDAFTANLERELPKARKREKVAQIQGEIAALGREDKVVRFVALFNKSYAAAAQVIADIMALEVEAETATKREKMYRKQLAELGEDVPDLLPPFWSITGGSLREYLSFGAMVRLPGVLGAPAIPMDFTKVEKTVFVEKSDWDKVNMGRTITGAPIAKKIVQEKVVESYDRPIRQDVPFWWPKPPLESFR